MNNHGRLGVIIALSIAMLGATVAITIPDAIEAKKSHQWCIEGPFGQCFDTKGDCNKALTDRLGQTCVKTPT